jgi:hypothetical protein
MYHVTDWNTRQIIKSFEKLALAKRYARGQGHTGDNDPAFTCYSPVAYVANDAGDCVYNPRFGKAISAEVGAHVNSRLSDWF